MKKVLLTVSICLTMMSVFSQGKNISLAPKVTSPVITSTGDTISVADEIMVLEGSNPDGSFKYIQLLNSFNEPIQPAGSNMAFKKQAVKFFKEQDGTVYLFTKYFVINIEAALSKDEVRLL